jgi:hypothetical protein
MDNFNNSNPHPNQYADPYAAKANFDANQNKIHSDGQPTLWYQVSNLLITVGIIAFIIVLFRIF